MGLSTKAHWDILVRKLKKTSDLPLLLLLKGHGKLLPSKLLYFQNRDPAASPKPTPSDGSLEEFSSWSSVWKHKPRPQGSLRVPKGSSAGATMQPIHARAGATSLHSAPGDITVSSPPCGHHTAKPCPPSPGAASQARLEDVMSGSLNRQQSPRFNNSSQKQLYIYNPASELGTLSPLPFQGLI